MARPEGSFMILVVSAKDNLETTRTANMSDPEIKKQPEGVKFALLPIFSSVDCFDRSVCF